MSKWRPTCKRCGRRYTAPTNKYGRQETAAIRFTTLDKKGGSYTRKPLKLCPVCFSDFANWFGGEYGEFMRWCMGEEQ